MKERLLMIAFYHFICLFNKIDILNFVVVLLRKKHT